MGCDALDKCPWCGDSASFEHLPDGRWSVGCDDSSGECMGFQSIQSFPTKEEAVKGWNKRTEPEDRALERARWNAVVEALLGAIEQLGSAPIKLLARETQVAIEELTGTALPSAKQTRVTLASIKEAVAAHYGLSVADITGPSRKLRVARPRIIAVHLARTLTELSSPQIGLHFGGRDHSTIISADERVAQLRERDADLDATIVRLTEALTRKEDACSLN